MERRKAHIKKIKIILLLISFLMLTGCVVDDVDDLKTIAETNQIEAYRNYYEAGVFTGLIRMGVPSDQADELAERMADDLFGIEEQEQEDE